MTNLNRRRFLTSCAGAGSLLVPGLRSKTGMLQLPFGQRTLVLVNLEGGYDALSLLPPVGAGATRNQYMALRPNLGWNPPGASTAAALSLPGQSQFGLHPSLGFLRTLYQAGDLAIIQKVGLALSELSHFNARQVMSRGRADLSTNPDPRGWLGRVADAGLSNGMDIVGVGVQSPLDFNANTTRPIVVRRLQDFATGTFLTPDHNLRRHVLSQIVAQSFPTEHPINAGLRAVTQQGLAASDLITAATANVTLNGSYPSETSELLGGSLSAIAKLIAASLGTRIFYTSTGAFDTHGNQEQAGTGGKPTLTQRLDLVMQSLQAFVQDLQSAQINAWNDVAIVVYTEFGRRNYENDTQGTDHGRGFHAFVLGGGIQGGLKGNAVTAGDLSTSDGNLPVNIDMRTLFKKSLEEWLQLPAALVGGVFDDFTPLPGEPTFNVY